MNKIVVNKPGLLTTVQDLGRSQLQHLGIPACGAMDLTSLAVANTLVGNLAESAAMECTWSGPVLEFNSRTQIALAGAEVEAKLNGYTIPMYTSIIIEAGDVLDLTVIKAGARVYLAVAGGIKVPKVLESRSTYLPIQFGEYDHRLKAGDVLPLPEVNVPTKVVSLTTDSLLRFKGSSDTKTINIVEGPQVDYFSKETKQLLSTGEYTLSSQSDRMGLRFEGEKLELLNTKPMISDGIPFGAMQITRGGLPIIMMADRQPTGGYPKIAKVAHSDLPILAQLRPTDKVRFKWQTLEESRANYLEIKRELRQLKDRRNNIPEAMKSYRIYINNQMYQTTLFEEDAE